MKVIKTKQVQLETSVVVTKQKASFFNKIIRMRNHYYLCLNLRYTFSMASLYHNLSSFCGPTSVMEAKRLAIFKFCVNFYIPLAALGPDMSELTMTV
jgi:hypothetical protein